VCLAQVCSVVAAESKPIIFERFRLPLGLGDADRILPPNTELELAWLNADCVQVLHDCQAPRDSTLVGVVRHPRLNPGDEGLHRLRVGFELDGFMTPWSFGTFGSGSYANKRIDFSGPTIVLSEIDSTRGRPNSIGFPRRSGDRSISSRADHIIHTHRLWP